MSPIVYYSSIFIFYIVDLLIKKTSANLSEWKYIFQRSIYSAFFSVILALLINQFYPLPTISILLQLAACSFICGFGFLFYIKALKILNFSNIGALGVMATINQQLMAVFIIGEKNSPSYWFAFCLMLVAFFIQAKKTTKLKGLLWILLSSIFWPLGYVLLSIVLKHTQVFWSIPVMEITLLIISFIGLIFSKNKIESIIIHKKDNIYFIIIAILTIGGSLLNNLSFKEIKISNLGIFQLSLVPLYYFISMKLFNEKPTKTEVISLLLSLCGLFVFYFW